VSACQRAPAYKLKSMAHLLLSSSGIDNSTRGADDPCSQRRIDHERVSRDLPSLPIQVPYASAVYAAADGFERCLRAWSRPLTDDVTTPDVGEASAPLKDYGARDHA